MDQIVQVLGSLLILAAFAATQRGRLSTSSPLYLSLNLAGAAVLAVLAAHERQLGFLLLESCWALVAGWSLLLRAFSRAGAGPRPPHSRRCALERGYRRTMRNAMRRGTWPRGAATNR